MRTLIFTTLLCLSISLFSQQRMVAEWEPAFGTLIRWPLGIPGNLVAELSQDDSVYVLVKNTGQQAQATTAFQSYGVNLEHCRFIIADTYSHWTRDWGPHYVFDESGKAHIADPLFEGYPWVPGCNEKLDSCHSDRSKGYEEDDAVNAVLADEFGLPLISLPVYLTGGNIMTDGHGFAVSTRQMLDENEPICDEACFMEVMLDSMGLGHYFIADNPEIFGIQHIDCYAKFLDEERILVKELPAWHPEYYCVEMLAEFLGNQTGCYGRKYEISRIFCASYSGDEVAAYTNSLILNNKVYIPLFGIPADEQALETYQELMPGYEIYGFEGNWYYYDALHCRTMGLFDPEMLVIWHKQPKVALPDIPVYLSVRIDDRSETGLDPELLRLYWREEGNPLWDHTVLSPMAEPDSFYAQLPAFPEGTSIQYYFLAADSSGRQETLPRPAPGGYYSLEISDMVIYPEWQPPVSVLKIFPVPFSDHVQMKITPAEEGILDVEITDVTGMTVYCFEKRVEPGNPLIITWESGNVRQGVYLVRMKINDEIVIRKIVKN